MDVPLTECYKRGMGVERLKALMVQQMEAGQRNYPLRRSLDRVRVANLFLKKDEIYWQAVIKERYYHNYYDFSNFFH
jgi:hypothetical protein